MNKINPNIPVSEISRILTNQRKNYLNTLKRVKKIHEFVPYPYYEGALECIEEIRNNLELRRRSREGINVQKNIRNNRKVHSKRK